jgi:hypothetical protein
MRKTRLLLHLQQLPQQLLHFAGRPPPCRILGDSAAFPIPTVRESPPSSSSACSARPPPLALRPLPGALVHLLLPRPPSLFLPLLPTRRPLPPLPRLPPSPRPCLASLDLEQERRGLEEHAATVKGARGGRRWSTWRPSVEHAEAVGGQHGSSQRRRRMSRSGAARSRPTTEPS